MRHDNYLDVLQDELDRRRALTPGYSLRTFAKDLAVSPSTLSEALNGRHHLSESKAHDIAERLTPETSDRLLKMHRDFSQRTTRKRRAERAGASVGYSAISDDAFRLVSEWYHTALLVLTQIKDASFELRSLARRFGVEQTLLANALKRLVRIGQLRKEGTKYVRTNAKLTTGNDISSLAIKQANRQMLHLATKAVYSQDVNEREIATLVLPIRLEDLPAIKESLRAYRRSLGQNFGQNDDANAVYALNVAFFRLDDSPQVPPVV